MEVTIFEKILIYFDILIILTIVKKYKQKYNLFY